MYSHSKNHSFGNRGGSRGFGSGRRGQFNRSKFFPGRGRGNLKNVANRILDNSLYTNKASEVNPIETYNPRNSFRDFGLNPVLFNNILKRGYDKPTPIQDQAIKPILEGRDVIGLAATGTGKTAAFLIPLINKMFRLRDEKTLVIVPTRELAVQINDEFKHFAVEMKLFSALAIGGSNMGRQIDNIRRRPHMVVATPGRLMDLVKRKIIHLEDYTNIVLDEVDLMVDIGFINDVKYFISLLPRERQSLFFSATITPKVQSILQEFVHDPITVSVKKQETSENVDQSVIKVTGSQRKVDQLHDLLIQDGFDKVLIFGRTKHGVEKLHKELESRGFKSGSIHGNKSQSQRQRTLDSFKKNEIRILLATDVASRGLDIDNVTHVINYELPESYEDYIHRIGRTGRANNRGKALTFIE